MNKKFNRYTITSALPYANGPVHIGHLAGVYIPADIYARYLRGTGKEVLFVGGSDEHGVPITIKAKQENKTPQQIVDFFHNNIKSSFNDFGISFDIYSRTTQPIHHETASDFFNKLHKNNKLTEKTTEQYFDEKEQEFLADRYITGTCPHCGYEKAYGDQCESCGTSLSATELINPASVLSGNKPELKETKHWYLPLNDYENWLKEWILVNHKEDWRPNVTGQCKSWIVDQGLQPRAVTRDLNWGVKVPIKDAIGKVLYVWFDAPIGYISATREWAAEHNKEWEPYWKNEDTKLVHFIGKDNIVFHCIIFPVMLKAEGSYILPDNVPSNEFLNLEGNKISTSRNWAVWLHEYLKDFPNKQDVLRYVLTATAPETKDNDFTWKDFQTRNNSELVAIYGNFVNRALILTHKYFDGIIPEQNNLTDLDKTTLNSIKECKQKVASSLERFRFREGLKEMMNLARIGNKYLADTEPWKLIKEDEDRVKTILNVCLEVISGLAIISKPFLPFTAEKIREFLNIKDLDWNAVGEERILTPGNSINKSSLLFAKIEDKEIDIQLEKLANTKLENELQKVKVEPAKENISFDDFTKLDLRTGTILEAEKVPKTKKLLKLKVDTGLDERIMISGIAEFYKPEDIIGKKVCLLANLAPKTIRGIESKGMVLMVENNKGELSFMAPTGDCENGNIIR